MQFRSIKLKLLAGGCVIVFLSLIINGLVSQRNSTTALLDQSLMSSEMLARNMADKVSLLIKSNMQTIELIATDHNVIVTTESVNRQGIDSSNKDLHKLQTTIDHWAAMFEGKYRDMYISNSEGQMIAGKLDGGVDYKGVNIGSRNYFTTAKSTGNIVVSEPLPSKTTGTVVVIICCPIYSQTDHSFQGVAGLSLDSQIVRNLILKEKSGETGYAFMVDKNGLLLFHPSDELVMKLNLKTVDGMKKITTALLDGETGSEYYTYNGVEKLSGYAPVGFNGWAVGYTKNRNEVLASTVAMRNKTMLVVLISIAATTILIYFGSNSCVRPINDAVARLRDIAEGEGDLTQRLEVTTKDEIGELAQWFNVFMGKMQGIVEQINENTQDVEKSADQLTIIAEQLLTDAKGGAGKALQVTTAAEEMDSSITNVASSMEESTININMVASATEEMSATISEITSNAREAHSVSDAAVQQAKKTSEKMADLTEAAQAISKVTETITEISEQTNLLALNATIEAARAGEAGKGFAVVANEIKELAQQTSGATMNIKSQIEGVQGITKTTVSDIMQISSVIENINNIISVISQAVGEQNNATDEISNSIAQASIGLSEVNENVNQSSVMVSSITKEIADVNRKTDAISTSSEQVEQNAVELRRLALQLKDVVGVFKI